MPKKRPKLDDALSTALDALETSPAAGAERRSKEELATVLEIFFEELAKEPAKRTGAVI